MADTDQTLKILIELGILGEKDAQAAKELIDETKSAVKDLSMSLPEGAEGWSKYKHVLGGTSNEAEGFNVRGREMKKVMGEIEQVVPGLGQAMQGLMQVITRTGGGFIAVQLAIEAIKTYWQLYQDSVTEAAAAHGRALDKIRESTAGARIEMEEFAKAQEKALKPPDAEADAIARERAVLAAQFKGRRELLNKDQELELAGAGTPEQQAAVRAKYAAKSSALDSEEENANLNVLKGTIKSLEDQKSDLEKKRAELQDARQTEIEIHGRKMGAGYADTEGAAKISQMTGQMAELGQKLNEVTTKLTRYSGEADTAGRLHGINDFTRTAESNRTVSKAVMEGIEPAMRGAQLSDEQRQANAALTQLFGQYNGGIQTMRQIVAYHIAHSTTQAQQIEALKQALATLQRTGNR